MEKYLDITKPRYSEQVLPVPWHFARCSALDTASTQFYTLRILILAMGRNHLHGKNRKFRLEDQMVRAIPLGKFQEIWAVIWGNAIFLPFLVFSADLEILCSGFFSHHVKFYSFMFMRKISTRVVCVIG